MHRMTVQPESPSPTNSLSDQNQLCCKAQKECSREIPGGQVGIEHSTISDSDRNRGTDMDLLRYHPVETGTDCLPSHMHHRSYSYWRGDSAQLHHPLLSASNRIGICMRM